MLSDAIFARHTFTLQPNIPLEIVNSICRSLLQLLQLFNALWLHCTVVAKFCSAGLIVEIRSTPGNCHSYLIYHNLQIIATQLSMMPKRLQPELHIKIQNMMQNNLAWHRERLDCLGTFTIKEVTNFSVSFSSCCAQCYAIARTYLGGRFSVPCSHTLKKYEIRFS